MLAANAYLPPPPVLAELHFTGFRLGGSPGRLRASTTRTRSPSSRRSRGAERADGFLFLTHSDTDLLVLSKAAGRLPADFPPVRAFGLNHLKNDADVDAFLDNVLPGAEVIVVRLMGGRASFAHGLDRIVEHVQRDRQMADLPARHRRARPGADGAVHRRRAGRARGVRVPAVRRRRRTTSTCCAFWPTTCWRRGFGFDPPGRAAAPRRLPPGPRRRVHRSRRCAPATIRTQPTLGVLFYRSHLLSGNTDFVDAMVREIEARGANALPVFAYSLRTAPTTRRAAARAALLRPGRVDVVLATMSFAMGHVNLGRADARAGGRSRRWSGWTYRSCRRSPSAPATRSGTPRRADWHRSTRR